MPATDTHRKTKSRGFLFLAFGKMREELKREADAHG